MDHRISSIIYGVIIVRRTELDRLAVPQISILKPLILLFTHLLPICFIKVQSCQISLPNRTLIFRGLSDFSHQLTIATINGGAAARNTMDRRKPDLLLDINSTIYLNFKKFNSLYWNRTSIMLDLEEIQLKTSLKIFHILMLRQGRLYELRHFNPNQSYL